MSKIFDFKAALSKFFIPLAVVIFVLFSFSVTTSAEITSVEFTMEEEPVFIDEKTIDEIIEFYANATRTDLFSAETNTFVKRELKLEEKKSAVEKNAVVHTFKVTDVQYVDTDNISDFVSDIVENIFIELTSSLGKKYVSTLIYMYGASYEVTYDPETGDVTEMLLHIALVVGDDFDQVDNLIATIIKPKADEWREYPAVKQIIELNNYILDGHLQYDVKGEQRKSTVEFVAHGKGVCEEYAGLTALFLDELGFKNMLVRGYAVVDKENVEHVWNLVNIDGKWYHLDILWNGPVDENGVHTDITADYLLKSAKTIKKDHLTLSVYYADSEKATEDYDLSEYIYNGDIVTPQMKLDMAREALAEAIDAAFDVCFRHASSYTVDSVNRMMPVYDAAKKLYDDETATIEQIDAETAKVKNALENYVVEFVEADKTKLYKSLSQAYECMLYDYALYTTESVKALSEPYEAAVIVYQNKYATQKEVDAARSNLKKVLNKLVKIVVEDPEVEVVPDTETTTPVDPDNNTDTPVVVTPITPLPDIDQNKPEEIPEEDVKTEKVGEIPADSLTPEETPNEENSEDNEISEDEEISSEENVEIEEDVNTEKAPENNENENKEEPKEPVAPVVTPSEPSGIDSDIIMYIIVALVALGGIIYLIVSKVRSGNEEETEEGSEETSSEDTVESAETVEDTKDEEAKVEATEVPAAVVPVVEEKPEETKQGDAESEEKPEEQKEEASEKQAEPDDVKEENKETEAPSEPEKAEETSDEAEVSDTVIVAAAVEENKEENSDEKAEGEPSEEASEGKTETVEEKVEAEKTVEISDTVKEKETESEKVSEDNEETAETIAEKVDEEKEETVSVIEEKTEESEKTEPAVEADAEEKQEEISPVEQKNQEKASRLLKYFSAKNEKLKKKEKVDK